MTRVATEESEAGRAIQEAWRELDVAQCGYCQSGQIMSAAALLERVPRPTNADIDRAMAGSPVPGLDLAAGVDVEIKL